jgi:hypothetical protein
MIRDSSGRALSFETPEQAQKALERLLSRSSEMEVAIGWVPMPRRPWRLYQRKSVT